jgi:hypothetical protein
MQANSSKGSWICRGKHKLCKHHSWGSKGSHKQWGKHQMQANISKGRHKMQAKTRKGSWVSRGHHNWGSKASHKQWGKQVQANTSKGRH